MATRTPEEIKAQDEALKAKRTNEARIIDELDDLHGGVCAIRGEAKVDSKGRRFNDWLVVLKRPERKHYMIWRSMIGDPKKKDLAMDFILRQTCVYPTVADGALDALLELHPAIAEAPATQQAFMVFVGLNAAEGETDSGKA
jgi:hypothetical protein